MPAFAFPAVCLLASAYSRPIVYTYFQRLHQAGWCHAHVSSLYIAATAVLAIAHLAGGLAWVIGFALAVLLIGVWLDQRVAVAFAVASRS